MSTNLANHPMDASFSATDWHIFLPSLPLSKYAELFSSILPLDWHSHVAMM